MPSVVFVILPLAGSLNASVKLARELAEKGHKVGYLGLADSEEDARSNGFDLTIVFERWFPKGFFQQHESLHVMEKAQALPAIKKIVANFNEFFKALLNGEEGSFEDAIGRLKPDLMIFVNSGETITIPALLAHKAGIRSVYLYDMLCRGEDASIPPVTTHLMPGNALSSRLRIFMAWKKLYLLHKVVEKYYVLLGLQVDWPRMIGRLAVQCGYPPGRIETVTDTATFRMKLPELVLYPLPFEFPGAELPGRYYIEPSIDTRRRQCEFPWEMLDENRPLGLCAMGTMAWLGRKELLRFFQAVIDAASIRPNWQWVIACGNGLDSRDFDSIPPNVIVVNRAPQLELLKRARLMVNHGGANTIKECIYYGVPMILFPLVNDTPGVTARAVYHGLGLRGDILKVSASEMGDLIDRIDGDSSFGSQLQRMREKFLEAEEARQGVHLIESMLQAPSPSSIA